MCKFVGVTLQVLLLTVPATYAVEHALHVAILGTAEESTCTPGLASPGAWEGCVDPVHAPRKPCTVADDTDENKVQAILNKFDGILSTLPGALPQKYGGYVGVFLDKGYLGGETGSAIYTAHLNALDKICAESGGHGYGLVLEGDTPARALQPAWLPAIPAKSGLSPLAEVMASQPDVTVFNLGPSASFCEFSTREAVFRRGQCFGESRAGDWGAIAVGYNLKKACSTQFRQAQRSLVGCVPSDLGLYSGMDGFVSVTAAIPFFEVLPHESTHSGDGVHVRLTKTNKETISLWDDFVRHRHGSCLKPPSPRCGKDFNDAASRCGNTCAVDSDCDKSESCFQYLPRKPCDIVDGMSWTQMKLQQKMHLELYSLKEKGSTSQEIAATKNVWQKLHDDEISREQPVPSGLMTPGVCKDGMVDIQRLNFTVVDPDPELGSFGKFLVE